MFSYVPGGGLCSLCFVYIKGTLTKLLALVLDLIVLVCSCVLPVVLYWFKYYSSKSCSGNTAEARISLYFCIVLRVCQAGWKDEDTWMYFCAFLDL